MGNCLETSSGEKLESKNTCKNVLSLTGPPLFKNCMWSKAQSAPPPIHNNPNCVNIIPPLSVYCVYILFTIFAALPGKTACQASRFFLFVTQDERYLRQIKHWNSKMRGTQYRNWNLTNSISVQYMKNTNLNIKADNDCFLSYSLCSWVGKGGWRKGSWNGYRKDGNIAFIVLSTICLSNKRYHIHMPLLFQSFQIF